MIAKILGIMVLILTAPWCFAQKDQSQAVAYHFIYQNFSHKFISKDGRVIDFSDDRLITTSEGQSYALFFALVNHDQMQFDKILQWTVNNLAKGNLSQNLPAWLWGQELKTKQWQVLDQNSASDADLWIAYSLLEAGRLWHNTYYKNLGLSLLKQIETKETVVIPNLGRLVLPGEFGFVHSKSWKLNPSYSPIQLMRYFSQYSDIWMEITQNTATLLLQTSPYGYAPNWITFSDDWNLKEAELCGSYDAIRVYLWAGMLSNKEPFKKILLKKFNLFDEKIKNQGVPPQKLCFNNPQLKNQGPIGFSGAVLPFLKDAQVQQQQFKRIVQQYYDNDSYYNNMLILFGLGWYANLYKFDEKGDLVSNRSQYSD